MKLRTECLKKINITLNLSMVFNLVDVNSIYCPLNYRFLIGLHDRVAFKKIVARSAMG